MPTQHQQLITFIRDNHQCTTSYIIENCLADRIPASTVRARLAELRRSGRLVHTLDGWSIAQAGTENLYENGDYPYHYDQPTSRDREDGRTDEELDEELDENGEAVSEAVDRITASRTRPVRRRNHTESYEYLGETADQRIERERARTNVNISASERIINVVESTCDQRIKEVGVEIEGGWNDDNYPTESHMDNSVQNCDGALVGETASPPLKIEEVEAWMSSNYPDHISKTCGLHIHLSFTNQLAYMQLMDSKFYNKVFLPNLHQWGKELNIKGTFWSRLEGKNTYCRKGFNPEIQVVQTSSHSNDIRYYHLNYCYALIKNGHPIRTIETRLFPVFKKRDNENRPILALKAVEFIYNLFNNYLAIQKPEVTKAQNVNVDFDEEILEETIECV